MTIIVFLLSLLIFALVFQVFRSSTYREVNGSFRIKNLWRPIATIFFALLITAINPVDVERIDAGHVGIKVSNVGDDRGVGKTEYVTGWVLYNSWISRMYEVPIPPQHYD